MMDCPKEDRIARAINASRKIVKYNVKEIRDYYNKVKSYRKTMKKFNISSSGTLWYILHRPNIN
jgi:hypothetical protein